MCVTMGDISDLDRQIEQLRRCELIKENEVKALCAKAREILVEESNVQRVDSPVTVSNIYSLLSPNLPGCQINVVIMFLLLFLTGLWRYTRSVL
uniref:Uncharacterized protein n=1 Tax=Astatotilapia calliptera TaxID=8154 RepID=A0AAX7VKC6_ASTCA